MTDLVGVLPAVDCTMDLWAQPVNKLASFHWLCPWRRKTTVEHVPSGTVPDTDMRTAVRALPCVLLPARKALDTCETVRSIATRPEVGP